MAIVSDIIKVANEIQHIITRCPECQELRPDDDRVKAGMKCGVCAYGYGEPDPMALAKAEKEDALTEDEEVS